MKKKVSKSKVIEVFTDVRTHRVIADLIRKHSTNKDDVRNMAIEGLNLSDCREILDLGCGFGFFTEALQGRVNPRAIVTGIDVVGGYERVFLDTCREAGVQGRFLKSDASQITNFPVRTYDLILCSYALYFFADMIPAISRIFSENGTFIAITHDRNNMKELISVTKDVLAGNKALKEKELPLEKIIRQFSSENGLDLLGPWFGQVKAIDYFNSLVFRSEDGMKITEYLHFKSPFLLSGTDYEMEWIVQLLSVHFQQTSFLHNGFTISKNDRIFICTLPLRGHCAQ
jgi:ubiquinone/menaquinone biosynthesis C-methylase UbiE